MLISLDFITRNENDQDRCVPVLEKMLLIS